MPASSVSTDLNSESKLVPLKFQPLPLGSIVPTGWLLSELQTEADGLAGHMYDFYDYVSDSPWTGGSTEYSGLNEALPYWFNGLVPLAYSLNDDRLKDQIHHVAKSVLENQASDGWLGPEKGTARNFWGRYSLILGLTQLVEANKTWEEPIVNALYKFSDLMHEMMCNDYSGFIYHDGDNLPKFDFHWGRVRAQDMMISLMWLYEKYPRNSQQVLLDNMNFLYNGSHNWAAWYNEATYIFEDVGNVPGNGVDGPNFQYQHGVNVGQGLKAAAVYRRLTHNDSLITTAMKGVNWTFTYHGAASGTVIADERLQGLKAYAGAELCTAVETIYSLAYLYQALGNPYYADRAELTTFNALPAMITGDWWAHQYLEQANQPFARRVSPNPFWNAGDFATTFGIEPNYPCCAVNFVQGLPKYLSNSYARIGSNGIIHALLGPASVTTNIGGGEVKVQCKTDYPFSGKLHYIVEAHSPFTLYVRIPSWATPSSTVSDSSGSASSLNVDASTGLHELAVPAGISQTTLNLESEIRTETRPNDTIAVYHGALLYALEIGMGNVSHRSRFFKADAPAQSKDIEYYNTTAWNYAIDPSTMVYKTSLDTDGELKLPIFAPGNPPNFIEVEACQIDWPLHLGSCVGEPPTGKKRRCIANTRKTVKLIPYGSAKLHMADLPVIHLPSFDELNDEL